MPTQWNNEAVATIVDYRKGGPGNTWKVLDTQGEATAPSGGGRSYAPKWGRSANGGEELLGMDVTSKREPFTLDTMFRLAVQNLLKSREFKNCVVDLRVRMRCGTFVDMTNYEAILAYLLCGDTSNTFSQPLANNAEQPGSDQMEQQSWTCGDEFRTYKLAHVDISGTKVDADINQIISIGVAQCAGDCGDEKTGEEDFLCVTDKDATAGYQGVATAQVGHSRDGGATWTFTYIDEFQGQDGEGIALSGPNVIVVGSNNRPAYARLQDLYDEVANPFSSSTGITANHPKAVAVAPNGDVYAVGNGGYIYKSTDNGGSYTTVDAASATTNDLNSVAAASDDLQWAGGASGTIVKIKKGVASTITFRLDTDGSTITETINVVAVPPGRERELYIGTASGNVYRTKNTNANVVEFTLLSFPNSGNGQIEDIQFAGVKGNMMYVVQSEADADSRVLRDLSGGAMGSNNVEVIGSFDNPVNNRINSIAVANENYALTAGQIESTYGFMGQVS